MSFDEFCMILIIRWQTVKSFNFEGETFLLVRCQFSRSCIVVKLTVVFFSFRWEKPRRTAFLKIVLAPNRLSIFVVVVVFVFSWVKIANLLKRFLFIFDIIR